MGFFSEQQSIISESTDADERQECRRPFLVSTPSAAALLQEVRARLVAHQQNSTTVPDVWQLLDLAAVDLAVPASVHIDAGNRLGGMTCKHPACVAIAIDLALRTARRSA